jgi:nucleotide-binding universal stress UspA family protein
MLQEHTLRTGDASMTTMQETRDRGLVWARSQGLPLPTGRARAVADDALRKRRPRRAKAPIIAVVNESTARVVAEAAVRLARDLASDVTFVYVRRGPSAVLGEPFYQRRLSRELRRARRSLDAALAVAARAGVIADGEVLEGRTTARILELARLRNPRLVMLGGSNRAERRMARQVARASTVPVFSASPGDGGHGEQS